MIKRLEKTYLYAKNLLIIHNSLFVSGLKWKLVVCIRRFRKAQTLGYCKKVIADDSFLRLYSRTEHLFKSMGSFVVFFFIFIGSTAAFLELVVPVSSSFYLRFQRAQFFSKRNEEIQLRDLRLMIDDSGVLGVTSSGKIKQNSNINFGVADLKSSTWSFEQSFDLSLASAIQTEKMRLFFSLWGNMQALIGRWNKENSDKQ